MTTTPEPVQGNPIPARYLQAGMHVLINLPWRDDPITCEVVEAIPTGTVRMGDVGPNAVPNVELRLLGMPAPCKGTITCDGEQRYIVLANA